MEIYGKFWNLTQKKMMMLIIASTARLIKINNTKPAQNCTNLEDHNLSKKNMNSNFTMAG